MMDVHDFVALFHDREGLIANALWRAGITSLYCCRYQRYWDTSVYFRARSEWEHFGNFSYVPMWKNASISDHYYGCGTRWQTLQS